MRSLAFGGSAQQHRHAGSMHHCVLQRRQLEANANAETAVQPARVAGAGGEGAQMLAGTWRQKTRRRVRLCERSGSSSAAHRTSRPSHTCGHPPTAKPQSAPADWDEQHGYGSKVSACISQARTSTAATAASSASAAAGHHIDGEGYE